MPRLDVENDECDSLVEETGGGASSSKPSLPGKKKHTSGGSITRFCPRIYSIGGLVVIAAFLLLAKFSIKDTYEGEELEEVSSKEILTPHLTPVPVVGPEESPPNDNSNNNDVDEQDATTDGESGIEIDDKPDDQQESEANTPSEENPFAVVSDEGETEGTDAQQPDDENTNEDEQAQGEEDQLVDENTDTTADAGEEETETQGGVTVDGGEPAIDDEETGDGTETETENEVDDVDDETETNTETETGDSNPDDTDPGESQTTEPVDEIVSIYGEKRGYMKPARLYSESYVKRRVDVDPKTVSDYAQKWGQWTLIDEKADQRPEEDFFANHPHRDIPWEMIPSNAWQKDPEYLPKFLSEGIAFVERSMEAILGEYGHSKFDEPDKSFEERSEMFNVTLANLTQTFKFPKKFQNGGWIEQGSYQSLIRRLLHAIVTEDVFTFVMGGHSAAAGHGNNFPQTYTSQVQRILQPVFARLGVFFQAHNIGMGGLGTVHNGLASSSIYGNEIDILMWDSGMTEREDFATDVFGRQALLGGHKMPMFLGGSHTGRMHQWYGADVGFLGDMKCCSAGLPETEDEQQASKLPWAARFLKCNKQNHGLCSGNSHKFNSTCWIEREDVTPSRKQSASCHGQASWHPGSRSHQIGSRSIAFPILKALLEALRTWNSSDNYALSDDQWHMAPRYKATQIAISNRSKTYNAGCFQLEIPKAFCLYPTKGRSEYLPRPNPIESSIRSIIKTHGYMSQHPPNSYDPPDVFNPRLEVPEGYHDALLIIENGVDYAPTRGGRKMVELRKSQVEGPKGLSAEGAFMKPGVGWTLDGKGAGDNCDGTYDSFCAREAESDCLLYGHNDYRGGIWFDGLSGWLVLNLEKLKHGAIMVKIDIWHSAGDNPGTEGWTCENNECYDRGLQTMNASTSVSIGQPYLRSSSNSTHRRLYDHCDELRFEYAIDGEVTSWDYSTFWHKRKEIKRSVELWTLLNDTDYTQGQERDVELAIRLTGCGRQNTFLLNHVYWT